MTVPADGGLVEGGGGGMLRPGMPPNGPEDEGG